MLSRTLRFARHQPIAVTALFLALGGTSYAASTTVGTTSGDRTILACQAPTHAKGAGVFAIVSSFAQCPRGYQHFSWTSTGRAGEAGPQGATGLTGSQGVGGTAGNDGENGSGGATGQTGGN